MYKKFTHAQLQQAFALAFVLHPELTAALAVLVDALDVVPFLKQSLARRKRSNTHYKSPILPGTELQIAIYLASHRRELDQESPVPLMEPKYKPTRDDLVVRYIKHLIWKTILFTNPGYLATALGCWLYRYSPNQITQFTFLGSDDLRAVKMRIGKQIKKRFSFSGIVEAGRNKIRRAPATDYDRSLVLNALKAFVPSGSQHLSCSNDHRSLFELLCSNDVSEWDLKHALIDPECGGVERLVIETNKYFGPYREWKRLSEPREALFIPDFDGPASPPQDRFRHIELTEFEMMLLNERHEPSGSWMYDVEELLDEIEAAQGDQNMSAHWLFESQVEFPLHATAITFENERLSYVELNARANKVAQHLRNLGVFTGVVVGHIMEHVRASEMIVGVPGTPKEDGAHTICADTFWEDNVRNTDEDPWTSVMPESLSYVMYTSGSTRTPKAICITHRALVNFVNWHRAGSTMSAQYLQFASRNFDVFEEMNSERELVAYVPEGWCAIEVIRLCDYLLGKLPEYMVPSAFVMRSGFPLTPSGNVVCLALPAPKIKLETEDGYIVLLVRLEDLLSTIFEEVLKWERSTGRNNFFDAGHHSPPTPTVWREQEAFQVELSVQKIFKQMTVEPGKGLLTSDWYDRERAKEIRELMFALNDERWKPVWIEPWLIPTESINATWLTR